MPLLRTRRSVIPGFGPTLGFTLFYLGADRADPARGPVPEGRRRLGRVLGGGGQPARARLVSALVRSRARRRRSSTPSSASSSPGCWSATASPASAWSTRWSTCRSRCPPRWPASRSPRSSRATAGSGACSSRSASRSPIRRSASPSPSPSSGCRSSCARSSPCSRISTRRSRRPPRASARAARRPSPACSSRRSGRRSSTGFALAFARGVGEYGSVVFISGNMPMRTEIAPLLIVTKLEQYDYAGATAIAVTLLVTSFLLLLAINALQSWGRRARALSGAMRATRLSARPRAARARSKSRARARRADRDRARLPRPAARAPAGHRLRRGLLAGARRLLRRDLASPTRAPRSASRCWSPRSACR